MKGTIIALSFVFAVGLSSGCNNGKYEVMKDGTKWFGKRVLPDGTTTAKRVEFPSGQKDFDETWHPDGTRQIARVERPDGTKYFDQTVLQDGTRKVERMEWPNGVKWFDVTLLPDGTKKITRCEVPNGEKDFDVSVTDGQTEIKRVEYQDGREQLGVTRFDYTNPMDTCYLDANLNYVRRHYGHGDEHRRQIAENLREVAKLRIGPGVVYVSAEGEKENYLVLTARPENEQSLISFGAEFETKKDRAKLCAYGFDEIQYHIRHDGNEHLMKKVRVGFPSADEAEHYLYQTTGAMPE